MWKTTVLFAVGLAVCRPAFSSVNYIDHDRTGDDFNMSADTTIAENAMVFVENINVHGNVALDNRGLIYGDIRVGNDSVLNFRNSGQMIGNIFLDGLGASLVQLVSQRADMNEMSTDSNYQVYVHDADRLPLNDVLNFASNADKIILADSIFVVGHDDIARMRVRRPEIEIRGRVAIDVGDMSEISLDAPLLSNMSFDGGVVYLYADDVSPIYSVTGTVENGNLYAAVTRRTDYGNIFDNAVGRFLDALRANNPNDALLAAMDNAASIDDINRIMARSARINPIQMMRPIGLLNLSETITAGAPVRDSFVAVRPLVVANGDFILGATNLVAGFRLTNTVSVDVSAYAGMMTADDDLDSYDARLYGGNIALRYSGKLLFVGAVVGATVADFTADYIFDGAGAVDSMRGHSLYGGVDVGHRYDFSSRAYAEAFVGAAANYSFVADWSAHDAHPHAGIGAGYRYEIMGIAYDAGLRGRAHAAGGIDAGLNVGFESVFDGFGGYAYVGIVRDRDTSAYRISITAKQLF